MEHNKNKKSVKFQGDMLNFCDFIEVFVFTRNHHLKITFNFPINRPISDGEILQLCHSARLASSTSSWKLLKNSVIQI